MTAHRHQRKVGEYVEELRDSLRLSHWHIDVGLVDRPGGDDGNMAEALPVDGRYAAVIEIAPDIVASPDRLRQTILHELLHLATRDLVDVMRLALPKVMAPDPYNLLWEPFRQQVELFVDQHAIAIAPLLPKAPKLEPDGYVEKGASDP